MLSNGFSKNLAHLLWHQQYDCQIPHTLVSTGIKCNHIWLIIQLDFCKSSHRVNEVARAVRVEIHLILSISSTFGKERYSVFFSSSFIEI